MYPNFLLSVGRKASNFSKYLLQVLSTFCHKDMRKLVFNCEKPVNQYKPLMMSVSSDSS